MILPQPQPGMGSRRNDTTAAAAGNGVEAGDTTAAAAGNGVEAGDTTAAAAGNGVEAGDTVVADAADKVGAGVGLATWDGAPASQPVDSVAASRHNSPNQPEQVIEVFFRVVIPNISPSS